MTQQLKSALALAAAGYKVFPAHGITEKGVCTCAKGSRCENAGKHPAISGWKERATNNIESIKTMWGDHPYNIGVACGHNGLVVLDIDDRDGGAEGLAELEAKHGKLPETRTVITAGGKHLYLHGQKTYGNSVKKLARGVDVRGMGGYVIAPGSMHRSGVLYEWEIGLSPEDDAAEAAVPAWLDALLSAKKQPDARSEYRSQGGGCEDWGIIEEGQRNSELFRFGCTLRARGGEMRHVADKLREANATRCRPPLSEEELELIISQVDRYPRGEGAADVFHPTGLQSFVDVPHEEPRFLLKPYIPEGALTIAQGNPGDGKTAFICKLAAAVSTGGGLLDAQCDPGNVLILSVEDDPSILRGRIAASGGDLAKCFLIPEAHLLSFTSPEIEMYIKEGDIRMVVFDPLQAFLGARMDMNKANETRPIMAGLAAMARRNRCAVVLISHLNKAGAGGAGVLRSLGSTDIPGAARSILHIGRNVRDQEQRLMVHVKSSAARQGQSIAYHIVDHGGVSLDGYSPLGMESLSSEGRKVREAAHGFLGKEITEACARVLKENPEGKKVSYEELGVSWPGGVSPKKVLDTLAPTLEQEGVSLTTGLRSNHKAMVLIAPSNGVGSL